MHPDPVHNRTVISLAGSAASLETALLRLVAEAAGRLDLREHGGVHPRVGVADVVPIVPLAGAAIADAAALARRIGAAINRQLGLPVYFYGAAMAGPTLADIRAGRARPDLGSEHHPSGGAVCVGARPPLLAYNVVLPGASNGATRRLAAGLRASAPGGMPGVQALAFELPDGTMQLSMNLYDLALAPPGEVLLEIRRRAEASGLEVGPDEVVGLCPAAVAVPAAVGRILECRLGAAAARLGSDEHTAAELTPLGPGSDDFMAALELCAELWPRLVGTAEAATMVGYAGLQLRGALPAQALLEYPERVRKIDHWLRKLGDDLIA